MPNPHIQITEATRDDVIGIVYVQATSWIKNYQNEREGITEADIRSVNFHDKVASWQHILLSTSYQIYVAKQGVNILGFIAARKEDKLGQIYEQHTLPEHQRTGIGGHLLAKAVEWIGEGKPIFARMPIYTDSGVEFYKKHGFSIYEMGEVDFIKLPSGKRITTIVMYRPGNGEGPATAVEPDVSTTAEEDEVPVTEPEPAPEPEPVREEPVREEPTPEPAKKKLVGRAELAKMSGVRPSTIKYYTEVGILPFEQEEERLARRYDPEVATKRLEEIKSLRDQGLTIVDIIARLSD